MIIIYGVSELQSAGLIVYIFVVAFMIGSSFGVVARFLKNTHFFG